MKIIIAFSCKDSSMLDSSIFEFEINTNYSLDEIISLENITCFHFNTRM